jgi:peptidoglycan/xylan/chitin deacetylase (PgdA/CDA1 family)
MRAINIRQRLLIFVSCLAITAFAALAKEAAASDPVAALLAEAQEALDCGDVRGAWRALDHAVSNYPNEVSFTDPIWYSVAAESSEDDEVGRVRIATWLNWAEGAVSCTFDDRLESAVDVVLPDLNTEGRVGTFYVFQETTGHPALSALYEAKWQSLASNGHEIGNHTKNHPRQLPDKSRLEIVNELDDCQSFITTIEPRLAASTFAYPYGLHGRRNGPLREHIRCRFPAARTTGGPRTPNPPTPGEMDVLQSFSLLRTTTLSELELLFEDAVVSRGWLILTFHAVVSPPGWQPIRREIWEGCLAEMRDHGSDLWVDTVRRIAAYVYARRTAVVMCESVSSTELKLAIRSQVPASLCCSPVVLSASIRVPSTWSAARIEAADGSVTHHLVSSNRIEANIVPDGQIYTIVEE